jgi:Zn-dependent metalloprotease
MRCLRDSRAPCGSQPVEENPLREPIHVCGIIPPHILRHIAEHGDEEQRARARTTLEESAALRGERRIVALTSPLLPLSPGQKQRTVYDAKKTHRLPGTLVRVEGAAATKDVCVNEAYDGSGQTYDFYSEVFGRNSIDDRGLRLDSTVHYGVQFDNAQWNGRQMMYGDGDKTIFNRFTIALDVIGHELTHGVTQYTARLEYNDQPGALNEHMSDVFGVLVKQYSLKQTAADADWLVGAGLLAKGIHGSAIRSMKAPGSAYDDKLLGKDPQPAHMRDYQHINDDSGGVHVNSGIPNHAFYLVATLLGGHAWEVAGKIWYLALTRKLHANASFSAAAAATFDAAGELFGAGSAAQHAVVEGWKEVGIATPHSGASSSKSPAPATPPHIRGPRTRLTIEAEQK